MTTATTAPVPATTANPASGQLDLQAIERAVATSKLFAWVIALGLPTLGATAAVLANLPLFAVVMAGCFLLATGLVCAKGVATFTGKTLRLLVTARLVIVLVLASLLFLATGTVWAGLVSTVLLWLVADRLMGRRALYDLWKLTRQGR